MNTKIHNITDTDAQATSYTVNYVDKEALAEEIRQYYDTGVPTDTLGNYIISIVTNIMDGNRWRGYYGARRDDMYSDAIYKCWEAVERHNVEPDRAFAYLTTVTYNILGRRADYYRAKDDQYAMYKDFAAHMGMAYDLDENTATSTEEDWDLYEYCCSDH